MKYEATYKRSRKVMDYNQLQGVYMTFEYHGFEYEIYRPLNGYTGCSEKDQHDREQQRIDYAIAHPQSPMDIEQARIKNEIAMEELNRAIKEVMGDDGNTKT